MKRIVLLFICTVTSLLVAKAQIPFPSNLVANGNINASVYDPATQKTYVAGDFTALGDPRYANLAALNSLGNNIPNALPAINGPVSKIIADGNNFYVVGQFHRVNGVLRMGIIKLNSNKQLDLSFNPSIEIDTNSSNASMSGIYDIDIKGNLIAISGQFKVNGVQRVVAIIDKTNGAINSWAPNFSYNYDLFDNKINEVEFSTTNNLLFIGGQFNMTVLPNTGSIIRKGFAAFSISSTNTVSLSAGFNFGLYNSNGQQATVKAISKIGTTMYIGGYFDGGTNFVGKGIFACDMTAGSITSGFNPGLTGSVNSIAIVSSNQIFVAGMFSTPTVNGNKRNNFALLSSTGAFTQSSSLIVNSTLPLTKISIVNTGTNTYRLFISGFILQLYNTYRPDNKRLYGMLAYDFNGTTNDFVLNSNIVDRTPGPIVTCIKDVLGNYLIGGAFSFAGGTKCPHLAVLNSSGTLDMSVTNSFLMNSNGTMSIKAIALLGSHIYLGGLFKANSSTTTGKNNLIKINKSNLIIDNAFPQLDATTSNSVNVLEVDGNNLYIGGLFSKYLSPPPSNTAVSKLNFFAWNTASNAIINYSGNLNGEVRTIAFNSTNLFVGGDFPAPISGSSAGLAKFSKTGLNLLNFAATNNHSSISYLKLINSDLYVGDENGIFVYNPTTNAYKAKYNFSLQYASQVSSIFQVSSNLFMVGYGNGRGSEFDYLYFNQLHTGSVFKTYPMFKDNRISNGIFPLFNIAGNSGYTLGVQSYSSSSSLNISLPYGISRLFKLNNNISIPPPPPVPTISASLITLSPWMNEVYVNWKPGNGGKRVVLVRKNSNPVIPTNYTSTMAANPYFGQGTNTGGGTFCIYDGDDSSCWVGELEFNSNYRFAVVEYNTDGTVCSYKTTSVPIANCNTEQLINPSPASSLSVSNIGPNSFDLQWQNGDGGDRMIIIKQGLNSISFNPARFEYFYPSQVLTDGTKIEEIYGNYGSGTGFYSFSNLTPGTSYSVSVVERNNTPFGPIYPQVASPKINVTTSAFAPLPLTQSSNINITPSTTSATISWTRGTGGRSTVIVSKLPNAPIIGNNAISAINGTNYVGNPNMALSPSGSMLTYLNGGNNNAQVVYHGTATSVSVNGLNPGSVYQVAVFESNGGGFGGAGQVVYLTSPRPTSTFTTNTLVIAPSTVSNLHSILVSQDDASLSWSGGNANKSLVILKKDGPVNFAPTNDIFYSANSSFGSGTQLGIGNYSIYDGNTNGTVSISNLEPDAEYHFAVYDYNSQGSLAKYNLNPYRGIFRTSRAWPVRAGGPKKDAGGGVVTDASGNVYVAGTFETFGSWGTRSLPSSGGNDIFLTKYSPNGKPLWVVKQGGSDADAASSLALDNNGNTIMTGSFRGTGTFGTGNTLVSNGIDDIFISKLDPSGNVIWSKRAGGTDQDVAFSIATDNNGDFYIAGYFRGTITFPGSATTMTSLGGTDALIAKYDGNGNLLWAKSGGGTGNDFAYGVSVRGSNVAMVGQFESSATFNSSNLLSAGQSDIFIAEYSSSNGSLNWVNKFGGTGNDIGFSITTGGSDYVIAGQFSNSVTIGSTTLNSAGNSDVLVVRVNSSGTPVWFKRAGGISQDAGRGIAINSLGDKLFVTGSFAESAVFGPTTLNSFGNLDIFVTTVDLATGDFETTYQNGGPADDEARGITAGTSNTSFITGYFNGQGSFGNVDLTSAGDWDVFVHKFTLVVAPNLNNGLVAWYKMNGNANDASGNGNNGFAQNITSTVDRDNTANKAYSFQPSASVDVLGVDPVNVAGAATATASTYLAWIKTAPNFDNSNTPKPIFYTSFDDTEIRGIQLSDLNTITYAYTSNSASLQINQNSVSQIQDNSWHHLAVVFKSGIEIIFYLDGNEIGRQNITNFLLPETLLGTHWNIGHMTTMDRSTKIYSFDGSIDDVRIYRRALSSAEVNFIKSQSATNSLVEQSEKKSANVSPEVKLWPNPSSGKLNFDLGSKAKNVEIKILDISGIEVMNKTINNLDDSYLSLDVQNLNTGYYFVQLNIDGQTNIQKLIISK